MRNQLFDVSFNPLVFARAPCAAFFLALCSMLHAPFSPALAQQPTRIPRIGYLGGTSPAAYAGRIEAFRHGLRELGYVEGQNIVIERRFAEGKSDRLGELAAELVRLKVDILVSAGPAVTRFLKAATSTIPIIMTNEGDPVGSGFVASLARPGGNITGLSSLAPELSGKRLEILKETVPKLSRVAVLGSSIEPANAQSLREVDLAAGAFGVQVQYLDILSPKDLETAFRAASKAQADAVLNLLAGALATANRSEIIELAGKNRLPAIFNSAEFVAAGGLMSYAASLTDLSARAAVYVDKILKGRTPADLPVEQPTKFEFVINLKAAKQIGLTIPPNVLARADRVIRSRQTSK
jgi:putative ABC transport system substrate-binding protein